ncbi:hypothetical protein PtB15_1B206 [Puccinia triticina]|nr:hypothetical protein PtB15_1B206 [Puccinia triticina]
MLFPISLASIAHSKNPPHHQQLDFENMENTANQGESQALKNSLINLSHQAIERFDQIFQNILAQNHPSLHLHPLSIPVDNLEQPKRELIQSLELIKQSLRHFDHLLPRSTYLDPSLLIENLPPDQRSRTSVPLIEALARDIGLECIRDSDDSNLLTIAGKLFVIDIEIDPNHDQTHGQVNRSKFSYTFAEEEAKRDLSIDHELTHQLSNIHHLFQAQPPHSFCKLTQLQLVQNSLQSFARSLRQIKELDELMINQSSSIDYFMVFRKLISDYHQHHQSELEQENGPKDDPTPTIRLPPSGIPLTSVHQLQLDLVYHYNSTDLLNDAIKQKSSQGLAISVALTPTTTPSPSQSDPLQPPPAPPVTTSSPITSQAGPKGLFTAHFYPPLACSRATAAALAEVSAIHLPPPSSLSSTAATTTGGVSNFSDHLAPPAEISLEDLLVYQSMTSIDPHHQKKPHWDIKASPWKAKQFGKAFEDGLSQVYCFLDAEDVYSGDPNSHLGFLITQVRFESLDSLLKIIKICQRQSILNELFNSCFNPDCYLPKHPNRRPHNLNQNSLSDQERKDVILKEVEEEELDPFEGFHSSDYLANLQNLPSGASGFSNPAGTEFGRLFKDKDAKEEISIDMIMNHAAYSITLQFIPARPQPPPGDAPKSGPSSSSPSTASPTKPTSDAPNLSDMREDDSAEDDDDWFRLISLTFCVTEQGPIRLLSHSLFDDPTHDPIQLDTPALPQDVSTGRGEQQASPLSIAVLEASLDRVRCIPVLLNAFFFHKNLPSFPAFIP